MQPLNQLTAILLSAYFYALPLLVGLHVLHHKPHSLEKHKKEVRLKKQEENCSICDFNATPTVLHSPSPLTKNARIYIQFKESQEAKQYALSTSNIALRGPPNMPLAAFCYPIDTGL